MNKKKKAPNLDYQDIPNPAEMFAKLVEEALRKRGRVNVLIAGKTGVGKSTLINSIFQGNIAKTGQGKPVTTETREYTKEGVPVSIFDTRGLELKHHQKIVTDLEKFVSDRAEDEDGNKHIHVAWICISEDGRRVEAGEMELVERIAKHMPVIVVVTKARVDQGFRAEVQRLLPQSRNVVRVLAVKEVADDGHVTEPKGLKDLVEITMEVLPDAHRNAFAAAQKVNIRKKRERAHLIVAASATSAASVGAVPIPFSDAYALVPIQIGMLAGISAVFGLPMSKGFLATLVSSALGGVGGTLLGRQIVSGLLLLLPGAGPVLKGVISGGTAFALTTTMGEAYIAALAAIFETDPDGEVTAERVGEAFKEQLRRSPFKL